MAHRERHRSRSRSPRPSRSEYRTDKKRRWEGNTHEEATVHQLDANCHGAKRHRPTSPKDEIKHETNGVNIRSRADESSARQKGRRDRPRQDRKRSRSRSPIRGPEYVSSSTRHRSPLREPRSHRHDRNRRYNQDERDKHSRTERIPDPVTAAAVPKRRPRRDDPPDDEDKQVEYVIDVGTDAFRDKFMGFFQFKSTKNSKVPGNSKLYGVRKEKKTEYRQYMNRIGGFNRPLSPSRE